MLQSSGGLDAALSFGSSSTRWHDVQQCEGRSHVLLRAIPFQGAHVHTASSYCSAGYWKGRGKDVQVGLRWDRCFGLLGHKRMCMGATGASRIRPACSLCRQHAFAHAPACAGTARRAHARWWGAARLVQGLWRAGPARFFLRLCFASLVLTFNACDPGSWHALYGPLNCKSC